VARMGEGRGVYRILVGRPEGSLQKTFSIRWIIFFKWTWSRWLRFFVFIHHLETMKFYLEC
jgi:hypothetical protein